MDGIQEMTDLWAQHGPNFMSMIGMFIQERSHREKMPGIQSHASSLNR